MRNEKIKTQLDDISNSEFTIEKLLKEKTQLENKAMDISKLNALIGEFYP